MLSRRILACSPTALVLARAASVQHAQRLPLAHAAPAAKSGSASIRLLSTDADTAGISPRAFDQDMDRNRFGANNNRNARNNPKSGMASRRRPMSDSDPLVAAEEAVDDAFADVDKAGIDVQEGDSETFDEDAEIEESLQIIQSLPESDRRARNPTFNKKHSMFKKPGFPNRRMNYENDVGEARRRTIEMQTEFNLSTPVADLRRNLNTYGAPDLHALQSEFQKVLQVELTKDDKNYLWDHGITRFVYLCAREQYLPINDRCMMALEFVKEAVSGTDYPIRRNVSRMLSQLIVKCGMSDEFDSLVHMAEFATTNKITILPWAWSQALTDAFESNQDPKIVADSAIRICGIQGVNLSISFYMILIRALGKQKRSLLAERVFLEKVDQTQDLEEIEILYTFMFCAYYNSEMYLKAHRVIRELLTFGGPTRVRTYNTLIDTYLRDKKLASALELYDRMKAKKVEPNIMTYNVMINALGKESHPRYKEILNDAVNSNVKLDRDIYNTIINVLGRNGHLSEAISWFENMQENGCRPTLTTYNNLLSAYMTAGDAAGAERILFGMEFRYRIRPDVISFNLLLKGYALKADAKNARRIYEEMLFRQYAPDHITFIYLLRAECSVDATRVEAVLEEMRQNNIYLRLGIFESILQAFAIAPNTTPEQIFWAYEQSLKLCRDMGGRLYSIKNALPALEAHPDRDVIMRIYNDLRSMDIRPPSDLLNKFAKVLIKLGDIDLVRDFDRYVSRQNPFFPTAYYNALLEFAIGQSTADDLVDSVRSQMEKTTNRPNMRTNELLIQFYINKATSTARFAAIEGEAKDMDCDEFLYVEEGSVSKATDVTDQTDRNASRKNKNKKSDLLSTDRSSDSKPNAKRHRLHEWMFFEAEMTYNSIVSVGLKPSPKIYQTMMGGYLQAMRLGLSAPPTSSLVSLSMSLIKSKEKSEFLTDDRVTQAATESVPVVSGWAGRLVHMYNHAYALNVGLTLKHYETVMLALERMAYGIHFASIRDKTSNASGSRADKLDAIAETAARVYSNLRTSELGVPSNIGDLVLKCFAACGRWANVDMMRMELSNTYTATNPFLSTADMNDAVAAQQVFVARAGVSSAAARHIATIAAEMDEQQIADKFMSLAKEGEAIRPSVKESTEPETVSVAVEENESVNAPVQESSEPEHVSLAVGESQSVKSPAEELTESTSTPTEQETVSVEQETVSVKFDENESIESLPTTPVPTEQEIKPSTTA